jgi:hypothetical protein
MDHLVRGDPLDDPVPTLDAVHGSGGAGSRRVKLRRHSVRIGHPDCQEVTTCIDESCSIVFNYGRVD